MKDVLAEDLEIIRRDEELERLAGNTILVTGATGLIGSLFIKAVMLFNEDNQNKIRVIGLVRDVKRRACARS